MSRSKLLLSALLTLLAVPAFADDPAPAPKPAEGAPAPAPTKGAATTSTPKGQGVKKPKPGGTPQQQPVDQQKSQPEKK